MLMLRYPLYFALAAAWLAVVSRSSVAQDLALPPVKTVLQIENQPIPVTVTGVVSPTVSKAAGGADRGVFRLSLNVDLTGLQEHITGLLRSQLNQSNRCGERLSIEQASLAPSAPAALLTANVHFEKWACAKAFGKELAKKLIGGNAVIQVRLAPAVEERRSVKLESSVVSIQADGTLGDALRSGSLGDSLREKIRSSLQSSLQKAVNLEAALPPALASVAAIQSVQFRDAGGGRLASDFRGEVQISGDQMHALLDQLKARRTGTPEP
jgi:hypothetical protein